MEDFADGLAAGSGEVVDHGGGECDEGGGVTTGMGDFVEGGVFGAGAEAGAGVDDDVDFVAELAGGQGGVDDDDFGGDSAITRVRRPVAVMASRVGASASNAGCGGRGWGRWE